MTVTLSTQQGFEGRFFAFNNPKGCQARGTGRTETLLTFQYEEDEQRCGVEHEGEGVFSNTVVVQNHPVIQQKGDRAIKLYCYFQTGDKTLTSSYDVIADTIQPGDESAAIEGATDLPGIPTSIVNGTAPTPSVVLRITDGEGNDISGTRLGEALYLRIELDGDSIFDIFARNVVAKSGVDQEEIVLVDDRGCPSDSVFPGLTKEPGTGALLGKFEAFKFSETTIVNFEVNVQFCQDECNPVDCGDGVKSFGRRKRRDAEKKAVPNGLNEKMVFDPNLGQDVIFYETPLRKQIYVNPGIQVNRFRDPAVGEARNGLFAGEDGVFVRGEFEEGNVVCTTWTWVCIAATCVVFLVFSILVVCVLCIYTSRRSADARYKSDDRRFNCASSQHSAMARSSTTGSFHHPAHLGGYGSPTPSSSGYSRTEQSGKALKSLRTSLRD